jgi:hypothetical protein
MCDIGERCHLVPRRRLLRRKKTARLPAEKASRR